MIVGSPLEAQVTAGLFQDPLLNAFSLPFFIPFFFLLLLLSLIIIFLPSTPFLLDPFSGPLLPTLPTGSFLHYNSHCIFLSLGPVQGTFLQCFLLAHTTTHPTFTLPYTWPLSVSTFHSLDTNWATD